MNAKTKKIIISSIIGLLCLSNVVTGIALGHYINAFRLSDNTVTVVREQLEAERATLDRCRTTVSDITYGLSNDTTDLHQIIEQLKLVSEKVKDMESILYGDSGSSSNRNSDIDTINSEE